AVDAAAAVAPSPPTNVQVLKAGPAPTVLVVGVHTEQTAPRASGLGKAFSDVYSICTPDLPTRWHAIDVSFELGGDRRCGGWSTCRTVTRGARTCAEFTLQGHEEAPYTVFYSQGTLRYRLVEK
ncbi:MAG: hypothetical protein ABJD97_21020, partial [Betaproteobacteria bacterium]